MFVLIYCDFTLHFAIPIFKNIIIVHLQYIPQFDHQSALQEPTAICIVFLCEAVIQTEPQYKQTNKQVILAVRRICEIILG